MLETNRLILRRFRESDWPDLHEYLSMPEIYEFEPGEPISIEQAKILAIERSNADNFHAVVLKASSKMIGHIYFEPIDPKEYLTWELGYIFNPGYHRHGYCSEAAAEIIKYGFGTCHAHKIVAFCNPLNTASWKVMENIGMEREGYFRKKAYFRKDVNDKPLWHDCLAYGLLAADEP